MSNFQGTLVVFKRKLNDLGSRSTEDTPKIIF